MVPSTGLDQTSVATPDRLVPVTITDRTSSRDNRGHGGATTRRRAGQVGGSAKEEHTRKRHGRPARSSHEGSGDGLPPERATRTGWRVTPAPSRHSGSPG